MLQLIADWIAYSLFRLDPLVPWAQAINFFIYDSIKILLLLFVLIAVIGVVRSYLPADRIRGWISTKTIFPNLAAALFGALTPFCSCSSIPIFISFMEADVPLGVGFSFLITSPLVNEYLAVLMLGFFGVKITLLYILSGIFIGVICGIILGRMKLERFLAVGLFVRGGPVQAGEKFATFRSRLLFGINEACSIIGKLWPWILAGVGLGALIHNFVPRELVFQITGRAGVFDVPLAVAIGVPMYGSCAAIVPIAVALFQKGFPLGTSLAFMMAVAALSLPEAVMLRRVMSLRLIAIFFAVVSTSIVFIGYFFNFLQRVLF